MTAAGPAPLPHVTERTPRGWVVRIEALHGTDDPAAMAATLEHAFAAISAQGGGAVRWWVTAPTEAHHDLARTLGLRPERELLQLRVPLPLADAEAVEAGRALPLRAFRPGIDDQAWLRTNNRAFDWHPEQGGWSADKLAERLAEPWFDPAGFLVLDAPGATDEQPSLAGFVWTKVHPPADGPDGPEPALGEIFVIAADPDHAGRGLGRALTAAGLTWLAERARVAMGMLYVDADNHRAVRTYERLGFTVHHRDQAYLGQLPAA